MFMETSGRKVIELNIEDVLPNRFQPRIKFNEEAIDELAKSIKEHGVIQPIVVRPIGDKFEIIAGERRYKASLIAGKTTIPAIITDLNDKDSAEVALIENVQRENLTPIEEAISYKKILDMGYITQDALASKLGKTQSTVANKLRLLNLDDEVQEALLNEQISERHARSLLKLQDKELQRQLLNKIIKERLTVRRADEEIEKMLNGETNMVQEPIKTEEQNIETTENQKENEEPTSFKFINVPNIPEEIQDQPEEEIKEEEPKEDPEIKPGKFFNILKEEEKQEEQEPFNFDNIFKNINPTQEQNNNALLEELNEIEQSINNSNTLPPIFGETPIEEKKAETKEEQKPEEKDDFEDEFEFIEEDDFEKEPKQEKPVLVELPKETKSKPKMNNFKDVLQSIRNKSDEIEEAGFKIETEEFDLDNEYQVIFKIKKPENKA